MPPVRKPLALRPGSQIRIITPASPLTLERIQKGVDFLESEGYRVTFGEHVFERTDYLAGSDEVRAADLMAAFRDPEVDMVLCSRGGYGCARLFPYLQLDEMADSGKLFGGFSDVTTLHVALNRRGFVTLHCPMPLTLNYPREGWVYQSLASALQGEILVPEEAPRGRTVTTGTVEGIVVGGCLCLLADTIGTPDELPVEGNIVIIEDVDESPHRVDAMLTHFLNAGLLQKAAGIVVGEMSGSDNKVDEGIGGRPWRDIVADRLRGLGIPLMTDFPFGHMPNMLSLGLGIRAKMDASEGTLTYLEPLCELA